jgi:hypothetical protein
MLSLCLMAEVAYFHQTNCSLSLNTCQVRFTGPIAMKWRGSPAVLRTGLSRGPESVKDLGPRLWLQNWVRPPVPKISMSYLVAPYTKSYQVLGSVVAQMASRLNVMNLKTLHAPAPLATPAVSFQDFAAELAISFKVKYQAWPFGADPSQSVTLTFSSSCCLCGFGRPITSRVREGKRVSWLPASKLTPAKKQSAQITSRQ